MTRDMLYLWHEIEIRQSQEEMVRQHSPGLCWNWNSIYVRLLSSLTATHDGARNAELNMACQQAVTTSLPSMSQVGSRQRSLAGHVRGGSDGLRHQLRPGGRSSSCPSSHHHKRTYIRASMPRLWQNLCIGVRTAKSSPMSSPITHQLAQRHRRRRRTPASKQAQGL